MNVATTTGPLVIFSRNFGLRIADGLPAEGAIVIARRNGELPQRVHHLVFIRQRAVVGAMERNPEIYFFALAR